jgi:hypothetical protein
MDYRKEIELRDLEEWKSSNLIMTSFVIDVITKSTVCRMAIESPELFQETQIYNCLVYLLKETVAQCDRIAEIEKLYPTGAKIS